MKNIISVENVSFAYNKENVLQDIIMYVDEGDFVGIVGCNGSGKSTLMKLLIGQLTPSKGKIKLFNEELSKSKDLNKIGYVPQISLSSNATFPATVEEIVMTNLYSKIGFMKFPKKEHKEKVKEVEDAIKDGSLHVFDTSTFTVDGKELDSWKDDNGNEYIKDGYFHESELHSAPAFAINIDGIESVEK